MSQRNITIAALFAAVAVFVAGVVFLAVRDRDYESSAVVVLSPNSTDPERISSLLDSFDRSGTLGTYVELMASDDITAGARDLGVDISIRSIPDTRAIRLVAHGGREDVQPALQSVIDAAGTRQQTLRDLFALDVLESPSTPVLAGPGVAALLMATLLLAGFAAVAVVAILRRLAPPSSDSRRPKWPNVSHAEPARPER